jgi:sugar phosphate isomerase/epimerase
MSTRRRFLTQCAIAAGSFWAAPLLAATGSPDVHFPPQARKRLAVSSYPFREFIADPVNRSSQAKVPLKDFAAHVIEKFQIDKIEPWTGHFPSTEPAYLEQFRTAMEAVHAQAVNIACDGEHCPYSEDPADRWRAIAFSKRWIEVAAAIGSPSIRTNLPSANGAKPDLNRAADSLLRVVEFASARNVVIHLENDDPVSEDPFFLASLIDKVNSPWLHALPDFANTLATGKEEYAYKGIEAMFGHAYGICHVKEWEVDDNRKPVHVDLARTFAIAKRHDYKGYCSMEFDSPGDPYAGTDTLIEKTLRYLP